MYANGEQCVITNTVLLATDVPGLETTTILLESWYYGKDANNQLLTKPEVSQYARLNETEIYMRYAEFSSDKEAQETITFTVNDIADRLKKGIWRGAATKKIGDVSWYYRNVDETSIFVAYKNTCFYVDCSNPNETVSKGVCEQLALKIVEKIENGSHVIVSKENPPPVTVPAP